MRDYPLDVFIQSDQKNIYAVPVVCRKHDGIGKFGYISGKLKTSCSDDELGKMVLDSFDYILGKYENDEDVDEPNGKGIPWTKRGEIQVQKEKSGEYRFFLHYVNHEIMTSETLGERHYPADITREELGKEIRSALKTVFDYGKRQEISVFHSDKEGLFFVPNAIGTTGYVLADYCVRVLSPYSCGDIRAAACNAFDYAAANPNDKRTKKERKENLPWREFSKYKSFHGFVKSHHCVEMHRLPDGSFVFLPTLRSEIYGCEFVEVIELQNVKKADISDSEFKDELFANFERCRLIYEKHEETLKATYGRYEEFNDYVRSLSAGLDKGNF